jgi:hypothetical protein
MNAIVEDKRDKNEIEEIEENEVITPLMARYQEDYKKAVRAQEKYDPILKWILYIFGAVTLTIMLTYQIFSG